MSQEFSNRLRFAINCCSKENGSNTPDFILASFLTEVLDCWDRAVTARDKWNGHGPRPINAEKPHP